MRMLRLLSAQAKNKADLSRSAGWDRFLCPNGKALWHCKVDLAVHLVMRNYPKDRTWINDLEESSFYRFGRERAKRRPLHKAGGHGRSVLRTAVFHGAVLLV